MFKRKYKLDRGDYFEKAILVLSFNVLLMFSFFFVVAGGLTNLGVITQNDGRMPVYTDCFYDNDRHFSFQEFSEVNHPYFSDIIELNSPFDDKFAIVSIGDVFIFFGVLLAICTMAWGNIKVYKFNKRMKKKYVERNSTITN